MTKGKIFRIILIYLVTLTIGMIVLLAMKLKADETAARAEAGTLARVTITPSEAPSEEPVEESTEESAEESTEESTEEITSITIEPTATPEATITPAPARDGDFAQVDDNVFISENKVNLRSEPSTESEIIAEVSMSTLLKRIGVAQEWSKLVYKSQVCYVSNEFITDQIPEVETSKVHGQDSDSNVGASGKIVVVDPGHQGKGDSTQEPIGPGALTTKARVTSGTTGVVSGWAEYQLNLAVSLQLRDELVKRGHTVYMTRETHEVSMSNKERAEFATAKGGDILVRIHANGSEDQSVNGALCMAPTNSNQFLSANLISESQRLSKCIIDGYVAATGFGDKGVFPTDDMSGINWSTIPVTIVEMGYMSNASDDAKMADSTMQVKMVKGMCDGIDSYFAGSAS